MRQTWEEIGLDLAEKHFLCVGQLDDREITTSLGKRLLMVLSPFVFLQLVPDKQPVDPPPETTLHWTPLANLVARRPTWSTVTVDISSRLAPKHPIVRNAIRLLAGQHEVRRDRAQRRRRAAVRVEQAAADGRARLGLLGRARREAPQGIYAHAWTARRSCGCGGLHSA
jgi:hypothetical protein